MNNMEAITLPAGWGVAVSFLLSIIKGALNKWMHYDPPPSIMRGLNLILSGFAYWAFVTCVLGQDPVKAIVPAIVAVLSTGGTYDMITQPARKLTDTRKDIKKEE